MTSSPGLFTYPSSSTNHQLEKATQMKLLARRTRYPLSPPASEVNNNLNSLSTESYAMRLRYRCKIHESIVCFVFSIRAPLMDLNERKS
eukprot:scaffold642_cov141-Skeletonema_marinoi.AAC.10